MIIEKVLKKAHVKSDLARLLAGSLVTALFISLGVAVIPQLLGIPISPALPAIFGAIGAALYAASVRSSHET
ncbi:MAG: hypothetical protein AB1791_03790 [Chloroflexota bacterium]